MMSKVESIASTAVARSRKDGRAPPRSALTPPEPRDMHMPCVVSRRVHVFAATASCRGTASFWLASLTRCSQVPREHAVLPMGLQRVKDMCNAAHGPRLSEPALLRALWPPCAHLPERLKTLQIQKTPRIFNTLTTLRHRRS